VNNLKVCTSFMKLYLFWFTYCGNV